MKRPRSSHTDQLSWPTRSGEELNDLRKGAFVWLRDVALAQTASDHAWHWTIPMKAEPDLVIGLISLMAGDHDNRGFWIAPAWQRLGFASEAADVVTDYWCDVLKFPVLQAPKAAANVRPAAFLSDNACR